ncbi:MAG: hypothetical protein JJ863_21535 [Deltaproteobacteria bacterium]|nr:hypothetical protein [Deltaproteobacteria bacterium]
MNHTVISQEQLNQLVADAAIGRELREMVERRARESALEDWPGLGATVAGCAEIDASVAMEFGLDDVPESIWKSLREAAVAAATRVYESHPPKPAEASAPHT